MAKQRKVSKCYWAPYHGTFSPSTSFKTQDRMTWLEIFDPPTFQLRHPEHDVIMVPTKVEGGLILVAEIVFARHGCSSA
ncbi:Uncharacterized protein HZ326_29176 [Fusarium oxysporum f. sp. albedinis]|nr:Uncharacterized protein HZ326_29176 [Fusarium oxysporum f. sp. albedinis]